MHWLSMGRRWHRRPVDPHTDRSLYSVDEVITRRPIKWDDIDFPKELVIEEAVPPKNNIKNPDISDIEQTPNRR